MEKEPMTTATIKLFLVTAIQKDSHGGNIQLDRKSDRWARERNLEGILGRDESDKSGIYLLTGTDPELDGQLCTSVRLKASGSAQGHLEKDFWSQVTFFVSKDENSPRRTYGTWKESLSK